MSDPAYSKRPDSVNHSAPLPLGYIAAVEQAWQLAQYPKLPWSSVAFIMRVYHGFDRSGGWWKEQLDNRNLGYPPRKQRGKLHPRPEARGLRGYLAGVNNGPGGGD